MAEGHQHLEKGALCAHLGHQRLKSGALRVLPPTPKKQGNRRNTHTHTPEFVLTDVGEAQRLESLLLDTAGGAVAAAWVDPRWPSIFVY